MAMSVLPRGCSAVGATTPDEVVLTVVRGVMVVESNDRGAPQALRVRFAADPRT